MNHTKQCNCSKLSCDYVVVTIVGMSDNRGISRTYESCNESVINEHKSVTEELCKREYVNLTLTIYKRV